MKRLIIVAFSVLAAGCANQVYVTWNSDVVGATVVEQGSGVTFGQGPLRVAYNNPVADANGCYLLRGVTMRWPSGYERSSPEAISGCNGTEFTFQVDHQGNAEQKSVDTEYAQSYTEHMQQLLAAQQQQEQQSANLWAAALVGLSSAAANASYPSSSYTPAPSSYQTTSQSYRPVSSPAPQKTYTPSVKTGCSSDFECGIGLKCIKGPLQATGQCLTPVNKFGLPQQGVMPDPNSIKINTNTKGACTFDTQCGVGFRCDQALKVCVQ